MKVRKIGLGLVLAGFTLATAAPAMAQSDPRGGSGAPGGGASERSGGGGASTSSGTVGGGAVSSGGGGGGGVGGGGSTSSGGGYSSPSMGSDTSGRFSSIDRGTRATAPERRAGFAASSSSQDGQKANPRTAAGSGSGERAVPRGTASGGSSSGDSSANSGRTRNPGGNNASGTREVPQWSRPRGDRPATGVAVDRVGPPPDRDRDRNRGRYGYYDPYYYSGGYGYGYGYGSGFGLYGCGYACSPYYYPYGFGMGYGLYSGLGWNPYYGDPLDSYYGGSGGYSSGLYNTRDQGNLKLKVKPRAAKVYVDGYFVGTVDQFDGAFQKLALNGGRHKVEIRADGFETAEFDVLITPSQTITFQGELKRIQ